MFLIAPQERVMSEGSNLGDNDNENNVQNSGDDTTTILTGEDLDIKYKNWI